MNEETEGCVSISIVEHEGLSRFNILWLPYLESRVAKAILRVTYQYVLEE